MRYWEGVFVLAFRKKVKIENQVRNCDGMSVEVEVLVMYEKSKNP